MTRDDDVVVVESSVWIDFFANAVNIQTRWLEENIKRSNISLTDLILCEVLQGVRSERAFQRTLATLAGLNILNTGGEDLAIDSARNYLVLRQRGITIRSTIDCLIATFCIREGYALLHRDRDFDSYEKYLGLKVIHPPALAVH